MDKNTATDSNRTKQNKPLAITQKNEQKKMFYLLCPQEREKDFLF